VLAIKILPFMLQNQAKSDTSPVKEGN